MMSIVTSKDASVFISDKGAFRAGNEAVEADLCERARVHPTSRLEKDRSRDIGHMVAAYIGGRYAGHLLVD